VGEQENEEHVRERELGEEERKGVVVQFIENGMEGCSIPKIQIFEFSQTCSKFKMNFKFRFKMFVCKLISTNKL
jgi:hypothetical protein